MAIGEIFAELRKHALKGLMFHHQMAEFFTFLGLPGYSEMHHYHELEENLLLKKLNDAYILHVGEMVQEEDPGSVEAIPKSYYRINRQETDVSWRRKAVKEAMIKWRDWEKGTDALYKELRYRLAADNELFFAVRIAARCEDVGGETAEAECLLFDLESVEFDMKEILRDQERMKKRYADKIRSMFEWRRGEE